ncbi:PREDICTED: 60S ribosomal protein L23-like [Ipomoea nil]|uniref:60S ribosomal protein L23-like n=1 Tax=Ipomoea nil TaxID=35883 RepID=UPI0009012356|nr:PREDICTED: 60S ribosomal protein L23-like [Ipomoea nil]
MSKRGRGGSAGNKFRMSLGLPVAGTVNCADNTGAKNLLPSACVEDMISVNASHGAERMAFLCISNWVSGRKDCLNRLPSAGVIVNPKGEMKGSAITGPIGNECADLWPRIASAANAIV